MRYTATRKENTNRYTESNYVSKNSSNSNYFRTLHICKNTDTYEKLSQYMKANWVLLWSSWSEKNVAPKNTNLDNALYKISSCPVAEDIASRLVFLLNAYNRSKNEIEKVNKLLDKFYNKNV